MYTCIAGIGPDGHVAFNQPGSAHDSVTRLVTFNYPTAAAAASDLGGIEKARGKAAMTIGLGTIAFNPKATVIIMAAGEGKAEVIRAALEDPVCIDRPASALHSISGARFYITHGSACKLTARKAERIAQLGEEAMEWAMNHLAGLNNRFGLDGAHMVKPSKHYSLAETCMYNASLKLRIPVHKLTLTDIESLPELRTLPTWICDPLKFHIIITCATRRLREKVGGGLKASSPTGRCFLHTAPHHDDIMLSYHAAMHQILGRQPNQVNSLSPFTPTPAAIPFAPSESPLTVRKINSYKSIQRTRSDSIQRTRSNSMVDLSQLMVQQNSSLRKGELFNENINYFAYLTSGFHSVNDAFLWKQVNAVSSITMSTNRSDDNGIDREPSFDFLMQAVIEGEISREYDDLMTEFLEAFIAKDFEWQDRLEHFIFLRKICEVWAIPTTISYPHLITRLKERVNWIRVKYLSHHQPGDAVPKEMQLLKGCMRETEVDRVWALSKMPMNRIYHMRSKFYNDDFFTPLPSLEDDAMPMANLIKSRQPDVLTVAFDPEGTGPDTHYKVLQVVAAGLRVAIERNDLANPNPIIWGYRNVWFVFEPSDATLMIPASAADLDLMHDTFMSCFTTQKVSNKVCVYMHLLYFTVEIN